MTFRISLNKANKAQLGSKAKADEDDKARAEKVAMDKVMADFRDEHGEKDDLLGGGEMDHEPPETVHVPVGAKRHFTGRQKSMKSGPGTLEAVGLPPIPAHRAGFAARQSQPGNFGPHAHAAHESSNEENLYTTVVAKASNLPPSMDTRRVEDLFAEFPSLKVVKIEKLPPSRPNTPSPKPRPSATMKIVFGKDASARELDDAMYKMNDKRYLGRGYYLHLDRYLGDRSISTTKQDEPFAATLHNIEVPQGFAPPVALGGQIGRREEYRNKQMLITANAPPDIVTLRLIHRTIEGVIEGGIEFEAALMQDPQVQEEERFAWLFDQRHPLNRYYRWRLYEIINTTAKPEVLFSGQPDWRGPEDTLIDEYAHELGDLSQSQEPSDSDDEDEEKPGRIAVAAGDNYPGRADTGYGILTPRSRALLMWLLYTIPPGSSVLYDEVAHVSYFAACHATKGLDEIVHILITNLFQPFALSPANPKNGAEPPENEEDTGRHLPHLVGTGLRIISDILQTTSKQGGQCYKYRSVIGKQLVERKVFEYLETLPSRLSMGRVSQRSYQTDVNSILKVWRNELLFENDILEHLDHAFNARQRQKEQEDKERKAEERRQRKKKIALANDPRGVTGYLDGVMDERSGEDEDYVIEEDDEGTAISGAKQGDEAMETDEMEVGADSKDNAGAEVEQDNHQASEVQEVPGESAAARARRLRPKAEDMFASDGE